MQSTFTRLFGSAVILAAVSAGTIGSAQAGPAGGAVSSLGGFSPKDQALVAETDAQLAAMRTRAAKHPWVDAKGTESPDKKWRVVFSGTPDHRDIYIVPSDGQGYTHLSGPTFDNVPNLGATFARTADNANWMVDIVASDAESSPQNPAPSSIPGAPKPADQNSDIASDGAGNLINLQVSLDTKMKAKAARTLVRIEFQPQYIEYKYPDGRIEKHETNGGGVGAMTAAGAQAAPAVKTAQPAFPHMIQPPNPNYSHAYYIGANLFPNASESSNTPELSDVKATIADMMGGFTGTVARQ